ncbi:hypothetical protein [Mucilaginibacter terrae]|uniref:Uncharacterized protein n=1 Tax=Mucilaginibacter terrae TaxID=1955052 RepID=A0ABU3H0X7_9SPHI|nr:hypothetical protein [Mucilaginibacter terrae]MDT3405551.1 hypothetical protein [Mucilaginibacter terrae]
MRRRIYNFFGSRIVRPRTDNTNDEDYYERNESRLQFWVNVALSILTLATLFVTYYYSRKNLILSTKQYESAVSQFNYQRKSDSLKNIADSLKDVLQRNKYTADSINVTIKDSFQKIQSLHQEELNEQQIEINRQQLKAITSQSRTAEQTFKEQQLQYKEQLYEKRPVFTITDVIIDSTRRMIPKISFQFRNVGFRTAHVDSTVFAFFNPIKLCFSSTPNPSNFDVIPNGMTLTTSEVNIYIDCLKSPLTQYYLLIYYTDTSTGIVQKEPIFFTYIKKPNEPVSTKKIIPRDRTAFEQRLRKGKIFVPGF